ncbi:hypothetical protein BB561_002346 [Smittium simulii]|uniref:Response regulatory domain-containing protein n=1 Tax=Smittium simulii TaxID=133385 RepID=A0A2T9YQZ6_9FUNG|nr:hypothetical protein BB561_002346 [Smittium simulii]
MFTQDDELAKILAGVPEFVKKLFRILEMESYKDIILWSNSGKSFLVNDQAKFSNFFKHQSFQKNHPKLLERIKRKPVGKARTGRLSFDPINSTNSIVSGLQPDSLNSRKIDTTPTQCSALSYNIEPSDKPFEFSNLDSTNTIPTDQSKPINPIAELNNQVKFLLSQNNSIIQYITNLTSHYNNTISELAGCLKSSHRNNIIMSDFIKSIDSPNQEAQKLKNDLLNSTNEILDFTKISQFSNFGNPLNTHDQSISQDPILSLENIPSATNFSFISQLPPNNTDSNVFNASNFNFKPSNSLDKLPVHNFKLDLTNSKQISDPNSSLVESSDKSKTNLENISINYPTIPTTKSNNLNTPNPIALNNLQDVITDTNKGSNFNTSKINSTLEEDSISYQAFEKNKDKYLDSTSNKPQYKPKNDNNTNINTMSSDLAQTNSDFVNSFNHNIFENNESAETKNDGRKSLDLLYKNINKQSLINEMLSKEVNFSHKHFLDNSDSRFAIVFKKSKYSQKSSSIIKNLNKINLKAKNNGSIISNSVIWTKPPKVLLVEDGEVDRDVASKLLKIFGCSIDLASDGNVAVEKMNYENYDIVLMDILMPNLDGVSATSYIRAFDKITPIISVTSTADKKSCTLYFNTGMNEVLEKPITKDNVFKILNKYCAHLHTPKQSKIENIPEAFALNYNSGFQYANMNRITEIKDTNEDHKDCSALSTKNDSIVCTNVNNIRNDVHENSKNTTNALHGDNFGCLQTINNESANDNILRIFENYKYNIHNADNNSLVESFSTNRDFHNNPNINSQDNLTINYFKQQCEQINNSSTEQNSLISNFEQHSKSLKPDEKVINLDIDLSKRFSMPKNQLPFDNLYAHSKSKNTNSNFENNNNQVNTSISDAKSVLDLYAIYKSEPHLLSIFNSLNASASKNSKKETMKPADDPKINDNQTFQAPIFTFQNFPMENISHNIKNSSNSFSNKIPESGPFSNICSEAENISINSFNNHTQNSKLTNSSFYKLKS